MKATAVILGVTCTLVCSLVAAGPTDREETVAEHLAGEHSPQFDHEAFLGKEEAKRFDKLSPQEARRRLGIIMDKIDTNRDGYVTEKELEAWVHHVGKRYVLDDVVRLGGHYDANKDDLITWKEFKEGAFGKEIDESEMYDGSRGLTFKDAILRSKRKFDAADIDGDKRLTRDELADFLHPENVPHMKQVIVDERMGDMDRNKDGYISLDEYLEEIWPTQERTSGQEPEWVPAERKHFREHRDLNKDGRLSREELEKWMIPEDYDPAQAEATHLISHADRDGDKKLSKEEILESQDVFVGSHATHFGEYLVRHDEF